MTEYRVRQRLWYPTTPAVIRRLKNGEPIPMKDRGLKVANEGEVVSDLPRDSIAWLLADGLIEPVGGDDGAA